MKRTRSPRIGGNFSDSTVVLVV